MKIIVERSDNLEPPCPGARRSVVSEHKSNLTGETHKTTAYVIEVDSLEALFTLCGGYDYAILDVHNMDGITLRLGADDEDDAEAPLNPLGVQEGDYNLN